MRNASNRVNISFFFVSLQYLFSFGFILLNFFNILNLQFLFWVILYVSISFILFLYSSYLLNYNYKIINTFLQKKIDIFIIIPIFITSINIVLSLVTRLIIINTFIIMISYIILNFLLKIIKTETINCLDVNDYRKNKILLYDANILGGSTLILPLCLLFLQFFLNFITALIVILFFAIILSYANFLKYNLISDFLIFSFNKVVIIDSIFICFALMFFYIITYQINIRVEGPLLLLYILILSPLMKTNQKIAKYLKTLF